MNAEAALVKEQGVLFAVVVVKRHVLASPSERDEVAAAVQGYFPGYEAILMAQDSRGVPKYYGRRDIVKFLSEIHPSRLPWKKYGLR